jgi:hypothetical protein
VSDWSQLLEEVRDLEPPPGLRGRVFTPGPSTLTSGRGMARRVGGWSLAAAGTLVVVGALILAAHSRRSASPTEPSRQAGQDSIVAFLKYQGGTDVEASHTLMIAAAGGTRTLLSRPDLRFTETAVSPDGRSVAVVTLPALRTDAQMHPDTVSTVTVQVVSTTSEARPRLVVSGLDAEQLAWSPDSQSLAFVSGTHRPRRSMIYVVRPGESTAPVRLTNQSGRGFDNAPSWSPDGRTIAFTRVTNRWHAMLVNVATHEVRPLPAGDEHGVYGPIWQPQGDLIAVYGRQTFLTTATSAGLTPLSRSFRYGSVPIDWSPDGRYLLLRANPKPSETFGPLAQPCTQLFTYDTHRRAMTRVGCGYKAVWEQGIDRIAYLAPSDAGSDSALGIFARRLITVSATGSERRVLVPLAAGDSFPMRGP